MRSEKSILKFALNLVAFSYRFTLFIIVGHSFLTIFRKAPKHASA